MSTITRRGVWEAQPTSRQELGMMGSMSFQNQAMSSRLLLIFLFLAILGIGLQGHLRPLLPRALALDPVEELQQKIDDTQRLLDLSKNATTPLEAEVKRLAGNIQGAQNQMAALRADQKAKEEKIVEQELEMSDQYALFSARVDRQYRFARTYSPLVVLLSAQTSANRQALKFTLTLAERDQQAIDHIGEEILDLQIAKKEAQEQERRMAALQVQLDEQKRFFEKEIAGAKEYQATLQNEIAQLSAQQEAIINARSGTFTTSVGDVSLADDFNASIGYKSQALSNSFAVFSFGGYTHRNGMSQYGAKARAEEGQSVEEILKAYYPDATLKTDYNAMEIINVQGYGSMSFEGQYLQGIYEMPASWNKNALKAQAIAARTYAIRHTSNGQSSICTTEACQVFKNSPKGGAWKEAVDETKNWVLVDGSGNPVSTQYASTHGGYTNTAGWDTTDKSGSGSWADRAWDNKASSPWFYKSWYRSGYSSSGANCGRNHPWLQQEEFSDIINAWIVWKNPNGADTNRIQPITINDCNIGGSGGNPYSMGELRDKANDSGGAVTSVSSVSVSHNDKGQTTSVVVSTNRGTLTIPGSEFKQAFNLRAPGYLRIPQSSFAFFNVEHKQ